MTLRKQFTNRTLITRFYSINFVHSSVQSEPGKIIITCFGSEFSFIFNVKTIESWLCYENIIFQRPTSEIRTVTDDIMWNFPLFSDEISVQLDAIHHKVCLHFVNVQLWQLWGENSGVRRFTWGGTDIIHYKQKNFHDFTMNWKCCRLLLPLARAALSLNVGLHHFQWICEFFSQTVGCLVSDLTVWLCVNFNWHWANEF